MNPTIKPSPRRAYGGAYNLISDKIVIFGGGSSYKNDTWSYDYNSNTWTELFPIIAPLQRSLHTMTYDVKNNKFILNGGLTGFYLKDTWIFDLATITWTQFTDGSLSRWKAGMVYDISVGKHMMFGGIGAGSVPYGDTWEYNVTDDTPTITLTEKVTDTVTNNQTTTNTVTITNNITVTETTTISNNTTNPTITKTVIVTDRVTDKITDIITDRSTETRTVYQQDNVTTTEQITSTETISQSESGNFTETETFQIFLHYLFNISIQLLLS